MPGTNQLAELRVSNDILGDPSELRRRFDEEGYVFIKGVFDRNDMLNLRREMMTTIQQGGWLAAETDPLEGIAELSARCTDCLLYTSPSPRDGLLSRMPTSA